MLLISPKQWGGIKLLWYPLCLFQSHAVVCGCPPTEERDVFQTLKSSHEITVQLTQSVSLFKHLLSLWFLLLLSVTTDEMASCKFCQSLPYSGVVGTNSPLILLMPELGLLYILNSSDPLCGDKKKETKTECQTQLWNNGENYFHFPHWPSNTTIKQSSLKIL